MKQFVYKLERKILKGFRKLCYGNKPTSKSTVLMNGDMLNDYIREALNSTEPLMVARFGSTEFENFSYEYMMRQPLVVRYGYYLHGTSNLIHKDIEQEKYLINRLCVFSGFFPNDYRYLGKYTDLVIDDIHELDLLGTWQNEEVLNKEYRECQFASLENLEPYDYERPWSKALEGKKVLVVHPFAKSIESQYARRELLWDNPDVLPAFELKTIKAVQTIAGEKAPFQDWFEALDYMKSQMDAVDYDVAIIGCGAYGFHLAAHAKRAGHKAIHLGGATQILFGIKGKRWEALPAVSKFFNEYWVSPLQEETPQNNARVEGGCYW